ncbi:MAG: fructose-1,6-bisphosphatase [SAR202 cluster bacterium]|nr:fructose-1,6-bisphosphatase [SAR202 cluster bacterium]
MTSTIGYRTLGEFMGAALKGNAQLEGLTEVVSAIAKGTILVQKQVQASCIAGVVGATGTTNVHGEAVQKLDAAGSDIFVDVLTRSGRVAAVGSEELETPALAGDGPQQSYIIQMDPVDGSSNIDVAISIGSIFGIWKRKPGEKVTQASLLRKGSEQVAAAYAIYGSCTLLVVATQNSVNGFTLDTATGEFALTHPGITIPRKCEYYSANDGNFKNWDSATQKAITTLRDAHSQRYVGSLVADFHRNLLKGGIFLYPGDKKSPEGKLRLMYEANPLGYVAEQAGGAASSGTKRILDIQPSDNHQKTPLILGNKDVVEKVVSILAAG